MFVCGDLYREIDYFVFLLSFYFFVGIKGKGEGRKGIIIFCLVRVLYISIFYLESISPQRIPGKT